MARVSATRGGFPPAGPPSSPQTAVTLQTIVNITSMDNISGQLVNTTLIQLILFVVAILISDWLAQCQDNVTASEISGHAVGGLVSQWGSTIDSP